MTLPRSLDAKEVARLLGVSRSRAYELMREMPHEEFGRSRRVREDDLDAWRDGQLYDAGDFVAREIIPWSPGDVFVYLVGIDFARATVDASGARRRPIKIGYARDMYSRLASLQTANPYTVRVAALFVRQPRFESELQSRFLRHRISGEWFALEDDEIVAIQALESRGERAERHALNLGNADRRDRKERMRRS